MKTKTYLEIVKVGEPNMWGVYDTTDNSVYGVITNKDENINFTVYGIKEMDDVVFQIKELKEIIGFMEKLEKK